MNPQVPGMVVAVNCYGGNYKNDWRGRSPRYLDDPRRYGLATLAAAAPHSDVIDGYAIHKPIGRLQGVDNVGDEHQLFAFPQDDQEVQDIVTLRETLAVANRPIDFYGGFRPTGTYDDPGINPRSNAQISKLRALCEGFRYVWFDRSHMHLSVIDLLNVRACVNDWHIGNFGFEPFSESSPSAAPAIARYTYLHAPWRRGKRCPPTKTRFCVIDAVAWAADGIEGVRKVVSLGYRLYVLPDSIIAACADVVREARSA